TRHVDAGLLADKRLASSDQGRAETRTHFLSALAGRFGSPDNSTSLSARIADLEAKLVEAASRPESPQRLDSAARAATNVAATFRSIAKGLEEQRSGADRAINS